MKRKKQLLLGLIIILGLVQTVIFPTSTSLAHGGGDSGLSLGIYLSLEEIYLLTLVLSIIFAVGLTTLLRINNKRFLILMISLSALFLTLDYFYMKFFVYS